MDCTTGVTHSCFVRLSWKISKESESQTPGESMGKFTEQDIGALFSKDYLLFTLCNQSGGWGRQRQGRHTCILGGLLSLGFPTEYFNMAEPWPLGSDHAATSAGRALTFQSSLSCPNLYLSSRHEPECFIVS